MENENTLMELLVAESNLSLGRPDKVLKRTTMRVLGFGGMLLAEAVVYHAPILTVQIPLLWISYGAGDLTDLVPELFEELWFNHLCALAAAMLND